jgi:hypothetical protein
MAAAKFSAFYTYSLSLSPSLSPADSHYQLAERRIESFELTCKIMFSFVGLDHELELELEGLNPWRTIVTPIKRTTV